MILAFLHGGVSLLVLGVFLGQVMKQQQRVRRELQDQGAASDKLAPRGQTEPQELCQTMAPHMQHLATEGCVHSD